jgi:hypothetical protein
VYKYILLGGCSAFVPPTCTFSLKVLAFPCFGLDFVHERGMEAMILMLWSWS